MIMMLLRILPSFNPLCLPQYLIMITLRSLLITFAVTTASIEDSCNCATLKIPIWQTIFVDLASLAALNFQLTPSLYNPALAKLDRVVVAVEEHVGQVSVYGLLCDNWLLIERDSLTFQPVFDLLTEIEIIELLNHQYMSNDTCEQHSKLLLRCSTHRKIVFDSN